MLDAGVCVPCDHFSCFFFSSLLSLCSYLNLLSLSLSLSLSLFLLYIHISLLFSPAGLTGSSCHSINWRVHCIYIHTKWPGSLLLLCELSSNTKGALRVTKYAVSKRLAWVTTSTSTSISKSKSTSTGTGTTCLLPFYSSLITFQARLIWRLKNGPHIDFNNKSFNQSISQSLFFHWAQLMATP